MPPRVKFLMGLVTFAIIVRLLPALLTRYDLKLDPTVLFYPWNFMPLMAVSLYSGATVSDRRWAIGLPLFALVASDLGIWALTGKSVWTIPHDGWSASAGMMMATFCYVVSIACYAITVALGNGASQRPWPLRAVDAFARGMLAEAIFFILTNFAYFLIQNDLPHTPMGLVTCYVAAIPFAWKSFASTAFYSVLLFSPLALPSEGESKCVEPSLQSALAK